MEDHKSRKIWSEVIFDIILICYCVFFLQSIISDNQWFFNSISIGYLIIAAGISTFFIIWYFGILFNILDNTIKNFKIVAGFGLVCLWIAVSQGFTLVENIGWVYNAEEDSGVIVVGYYFVIFYGVILGILFAGSEVNDNIGESRLLKRITFLRIFSGNFLFYSAIYLQVAVTLKHSTTVIFKLGLFVFILLLGFFIYTFPLEKKLEKRSKAGMIPEGKAMIFLKHYILPFILVTSICLLEEIYIWGKINSAVQANEIVTNSDMILHLFLSGVIPIRLLFIIHPPVTKFGLIGGIVSMSYFIFVSIDLVNSIF